MRWRVGQHRLGRQRRPAGADATFRDIAPAGQFDHPAPHRAGIAVAHGLRAARAELDIGRRPLRDARDARRQCLDLAVIQVSERDRTVVPT
jgi:hypothetical protein